jgi:hypothetical protein
MRRVVRAQGCIDDGEEHIKTAALLTFPHPLPILATSNCPSPVGLLDCMHEHSFPSGAGCSTEVLSVGYTAHIGTAQNTEEKNRDTQ